LEKEQTKNINRKNKLMGSQNSVKDILKKLQMELNTFGFDTNDCILDKQKPFCLKQKGFPSENGS
jgi:hypothetical protein